MLFQIMKGAQMGETDLLLTFSAALFCELDRNNVTAHDSVSVHCVSSSYFCSAYLVLGKCWKMLHT